MCVNLRPHIALENRSCNASIIYINEKLTLQRVAIYVMIINKFIAISLYVN